MKCKVANATSSLWRREKKIISDGLNIITELRYRLNITGDETMGEYNLQMSDITEGDLGSYWCERSVNDVVYQKQVVIKLSGNLFKSSNLPICLIRKLNEDFLKYEV